MPLSKNIIDRDSAEEMAVNYKPRSIGSQISGQALEYVKNQDSRGDFRVDKIVSEFVGIDELEKQTQQKEIAQQAIQLSREVQEKAYAEAHQLGLKEGREKAYEEQNAYILSEMEQIGILIGEIKEIKTSLMKDNERQIVNLCFYMARRLLMKEIEIDETYIQTLIKKTLEMAQSDEEVTIRLSGEDKEWIDKHQESVFKDLNLDSSTRLEEDRDVQRGGVIIETNYGVIDATVEQRLDKLESILKSQT